MTFTFHSYISNLNLSWIYYFKNEVTNYSFFSCTHYFGSVRWRTAILTYTSSSDHFRSRASDRSADPISFLKSKYLNPIFTASTTTKTSNLSNWGSYRRNFLQSKWRNVVLLNLDKIIIKKILILFAHRCWAQRRCKRYRN